MSTQEETPRILAVDDLPENVDLLCRFLRPRGFDVTPATSGLEALRLVEQNPPDIILLDLAMPDIDGFEVCQRLKANPATYHIPVIIITGRAERQANIDAVQAGADDFVIKPFDAGLLEARIRTSLRAKRLQDQLFVYQGELENNNEVLERCVRERTGQLERMQHVAVFSLAKLAESRDTETGCHLERMRLYAKTIAQYLLETGHHGEALNDDFVESIYHSSPLHDIGKVGIPDQILLKPGKLTAVEFDIMKRHATIGGETLEAANEEAGGDTFLAMGRDIAFYHHERWDGRGYPAGLKGEDIPLAARIVAVADVYDALTTRRPYKEAFSHEKARGIVLEGRGSHFDPVLVDAFETCEERFVEIAQGFDMVDETSQIVSLMSGLKKLEESEAGQT